MPRTYIIFLLSAALFLAAALPARSYWLDPPKPEPFTMHGTRETAPPSDKKGILTIQDNFGIFTRQDGSSPLFLPMSDYFIPADIINTNLPIFGTFNHPTKPTSDPIANLIYANLKLKKLVQKYAQLQQKAKELLINQDKTISYDKMAIPIHQELYQLSTKLSAINTAEITPAFTRTGSSPDDHETNPTAFITFHKQKEYRENQRLANIIASKGMSTINHIYAKNTEGCQFNHQQSRSEAPETESSNKGFSGTGKITIPLIINLPSIIFRYMLANKFESLFIMFFLILIISIFFGSRS